MDLLLPPRAKLVVAYSGRSYYPQSDSREIIIASASCIVVDCFSIHDHKTMFETTKGSGPDLLEHRLAITAAAVQISCTDYDARISLSCSGIVRGTLPHSRGVSLR